MRIIGARDQSAACEMLSEDPELARITLAKGATRATADEFFLAECHAHIYARSTALHVAAFAYDTVIARRLIHDGADVRARDRRGTEPLHAAVNGAPGTQYWRPREQVAMILYLIESGADPNAAASGGVTALHRAVRNRCSSAVRALLDAGADPAQPNKSGSTALTLAAWTTGRSGSGSPEARYEQEAILHLLRTG